MLVSEIQRALIEFKSICDQHYKRELLAIINVPSRHQHQPRVVNASYDSDNSRIQLVFESEVTLFFDGMNVPGDAEVRWCLTNFSGHMRRSIENFTNTAHADILDALFSPGGNWKKLRQKHWEHGKTIETLTEIIGDDG